MDQIKIGKFIAECRKGANLTQLQLAQQLGITDRAVSKWETGRALPDASVMLSLCQLLGITVNELLSGEKLKMEHYNEEMEQRLIELVKEKEVGAKRMLTLEVVLGVLSTVILLGPVFMGALLPIEQWQRIVICFSGFIPGFVGFVFAIRMEQVAGYYECQLCKHRYVPTYKAVLLAPHMGRTRKMKCPQCQKKSWQKKVISKE